jgi:hypothetical protein
VKYIKALAKKKYPIGLKKNIETTPVNTVSNKIISVFIYQYNGLIDKSFTINKAKLPVSAIVSLYASSVFIPEEISSL